MTKREICERLMAEMEDCLITSGVAHAKGDIGMAKFCHSTAWKFRSLLLDLAVPEEKKAVPEPKSKFPIGHPLHMSTEEMKAADTALFTQTGGRMGTDWRNAEENHPGVIAKPGKDGEIEFCWCQKCYAQAAVVHDPFGDGENWSYCQKCGVSFRLKRGEGEK